jgi:jumonji domain-containing protein 7
MYCVIKGRKYFTLLPPADVACLYEREFKSVRYRHERSLSGSDTVDVDATAKFHAKYPEHRAWFIVASPGTGDTPWIPVDPLNIDTETFPLAAQLHPLECVVEEGQVLYLPAMWYHRATQLEPTISVNYWHDMEFDCKYVYYNFVKSLAPSKGPTI